jgi:hypothetical protein
MGEDMQPKEEVLLDNLGKIAYTLDRAYMSRLEEDYGVLYFDEKYNQNQDISYSSNVRAIKVNKWLFDKEQEPGECLKNVLSTFADGDHTIALVIKRKPENTEMYFVIKNEGKGRNDVSRANVELLDAAIQGNFPGTHTEIIKDEEQLIKLFANEPKIVVDGKKVEAINSVALYANTPSEYSEKYITQGLDKLLNGIVPKNDEEDYTVVFLAESVSQADARDIISGYEDIASAINPFAQYQFQMGSSQVNTTGEMSSIANGTSITNSVFKTHSINVGVNGGLNNSHSTSFMKDKREASKAVLGTGGKILGTIFGGVGGLIVGGPAGAVAGASAGAKIGKGIGKVAGSLKEVITETDTNGSSVGANFGYGYSWGTSRAITNSTMYTEGKNQSLSLGESENTSYTYKSYMVTNLLDRLSKTMERLNTSQANGLWKFSTYVFAYDSITSKNVANYLKGITQGKESYIEPTVVQEWSRVEGNFPCPFNEIKKYVALFCHPVFVTMDEKDDNQMLVTPTSYVGTDELSNVVVFPKKSLQGIPVVTGVTFGREPYSLEKIERDFKIGNAYHLHREIKEQPVELSVTELSKHTFITGSTGSGKSNTVYWMLEKLVEKGKHFMVIEPAKGEYKFFIGQNEDVCTYGTNPLKDDCKLLQINPFSFPNGETHILEHLDRLVEIFNVCWPMYAAMPAILKDSIERAYVAAGWDLEKSQNRYDDTIFPTFTDVMVQIREVLKESEYSNDNKGDYIGSLVTRMKSLTNGINGLIFSSNEVSSDDLFGDKNVIIDLSRVGSSETKSLIMGILILKLQEYRMQNNSPNTELKHVTVIEEAHNLLKRTSTQQSNDGSNLLGKSVEMISNSIAEMRTYGEGFIIVDQSPALLDQSVIRNTNTKIIMRLPDYEDRQLVGRASGLNEAQIEEISRFEMGVAAITQSGWIEPVLCKISDFKTKSEILKSKRTRPRKYKKTANTSADNEYLLDLIMKKEIYRNCDRTDIEKLERKIIESDLEAAVKCAFLDYIYAGEEEAVGELQELVYDFFHAENAIEASKGIKPIDKWVHKVVDGLNPNVKKYSPQQIDLLVALLLNAKIERDSEYDNLLCRFTEMYEKRGRVF